MSRHRFRLGHYALAAVAGALSPSTWPGRKRKPAPPQHRHSLGGGGGGGATKRPQERLTLQQTAARQLRITQARQRVADVRSGDALRRAMGRPAPKAERASRDPFTDRQLERLAELDRELDTLADESLWADVTDPDNLDLEGE